MDASFCGLRIAGVSSAVPLNKKTLKDEEENFSADDLAKISNNTGILERRVSSELCTSDLCYSAAITLFEKLQISLDTIDVLIFVTQTPDYVLPATSCSLQVRLGLSSSCAAFDVNLGCSGYVYALWLASNLLNNQSTQRVLLLVGDTISRVSSPKDRSVQPLFGDAGTATLLEKTTSKNKPWFFSLGTNGHGIDNLIVRAGGFRHPLTPESKDRKIQSDGNIRSDADLYMNGGEIFAFTLEEVPKLVDLVLKKAQLGLNEVDLFVFHQANQFMLQHLMKRIKIPKERFVMSLDKFGNTSSASIPLTISSVLSAQSKIYRQFVLVGFGVGYSWAACAVHMDEDVCLPPITFVS